MNFCCKTVTNEAKLAKENTFVLILIKSTILQTMLKEIACQLNLHTLDELHKMLGQLIFYEPLLCLCHLNQSLIDEIKTIKI
jgi:hypothetical protein